MGLQSQVVAQKTVKLCHVQCYLWRATPGTVNVKISAAAKAVVKARKVQNGY